MFKLRPSLHKVVTNTHLKSTLRDKFTLSCNSTFTFTFQHSASWSWWAPVGGGKIIIWTFCSQLPHKELPFEVWTLLKLELLGHSYLRVWMQSSWRRRWIIFTVWVEILNAQKCGVWKQQCTMQLSIEIGESKIFKSKGPVFTQFCSKF